MRTSIAVTFVSLAAIAFFFSIIGLFGVLPALAALSLFAAIACLLALRPQHLI